MYFKDQAPCDPNGLIQCSSILGAQILMCRQALGTSLETRAMIPQGIWKRLPGSPAKLESSPGRYFFKVSQEGSAPFTCLLKILRF